MDYDLLRQKVELIIKGLECMQDIEAEADFLEVLDDFTLHQLKRCQKEMAKQKAQNN